MIIADTGFWLALSDDQDQLHQAAKKALQQYPEPLITTWSVITETCHLLLARKGAYAQIRFMQALSNGAAELFLLQTHHQSRIVELMTKYADLPMDLADASLVILAEELGQGKILSTDQRDFGIYRWKNTKPFQNLLIS